MNIEFSKIKYQDLNARQKENYNFHKVAAALADYGYNSLRLTDDFEGADFIAIHIDGVSLLKVQLKGRLTIDKKYIGKEIYIAFIENGHIKIYAHDILISTLAPNFIQSISWQEKGNYHWGKTPARYNSVIWKL